MYHPHSEHVVDLLVNKTGSEDRHFFRILYAFYISNIAAMMRTNIATHDRGVIPVNLYALNAAVSGYGKNYASNTLEDLIVKPFEERFIEDVYTPTSRANMLKLANSYARKHGLDPDEVYENVIAEFDSLGPYVTNFDSATSAAVKQLRKKALLANCGSLNLIMDEVGSNLTSNLEALTDYLSLYDKGIIKQKITKSTPENRRGIPVDGVTPSNLLMFGTPSKLLNGGKTEEEFFALLETGYARRLLFGFVKKAKRKKELSPEQLYEMSIAGSDEKTHKDIQDKFKDLASIHNFNMTLTMSKDTTMALLVYKQNCELKADKFKEHQEVFKAEMSHRYYKALKLAGAYAFADNSNHVTKSHLDYAIQLTEDSGEAFNNLMNRDRNYVKLANYLANIETEVTQADLVEDLPFYNGTEAKKKELISLAVAHGYKNNIIIKRTFNDGIEFFKGESLQETDLNNMLISWSDDIVSGYQTEKAPFDELHNLTTQNGLHFVTHELKDGYRKEDNCIEGTNLVVVDIDHDVSMKLAMTLLEDYKFHIYTTKRHTKEENRFRIIFPLSHKVKLDADNFKQFMENIYAWLPFPVDTQTNQRSRKWLTNDGEYYYNEGRLLDATQFIPKTRKSDINQTFINEHSDLTALERWFRVNAEEGSRNNILLKYGYALVDKGYPLEHINTAIHEFNRKLPKPIPEEELNNTVLVSVSRKISEKEK